MEVPWIMGSTEAENPTGTGVIVATMDVPHERGDLF